MVNVIEEMLSGYEYHFAVISNLNDGQEQGVIDIPFIGTGPSSTILFRFMGKGEEITFDFPLVDDNTDRSNGTAPAGDFPTGVKTINEQIDYLKNYIFDPDFESDCTLTLDRYLPDGSRGVIKNLEFPNPPGYVSIVIAKITFKLGTIGGF